MSLGMGEPGSKEMLAMSELLEVVSDTIKFKIKLKIGEDAFATLRLTKTLQTLWDLKCAGALGATAAASPLVASTFFASSTGFLSAFGIFTTAATPVGWVIGAAVLSGGAYYGAMQLFGGYTNSRVEKIPKFINTPIDLLGATIYALLAGLALRVMDFSGGIEDVERTAIVDYFVEEWGLSREYATSALPLVEQSVKGKSLKDMARALADFQIQNPDCNPNGMKKDIKEFLEEIVYADGEMDEREELALETIQKCMSEQFAAHAQIGRVSKKYVTAASSAAKNFSSSAANLARSKFGEASKFANNFIKKK